VLRSDDGGVTWEVAARLPGRDYVGMQFADRRFGWLAGAGFARTTDGGATWRDDVDLTGIDFQPTLRDVTFVDPQVGVAVGADPRIVSGASADDARQAPTPAADPTPALAQPAITPTPPPAFSGPALVLGTRDGGRRLAPAVTTADDPLRLLNALLSQTCLTADGFGLATGTTSSNLRPFQPVVLLTRDTGTTWEEISARLGAPSAGAPSPSCAGSDALWLLRSFVEDGACCRQELLRSDDGGLTWTDLQARVPDGLALSGPVFVDPDVGWSLAGEVGGIDNTRVLASVDGGRTWTERALPGGSVSGLQGIAFADADRGFVTGSTFPLQPSPARNFVFATADGGDTWTETTLPDSLLRESAVAIVP
jgi:photosystem II stability/assembly factor-like uncharacterized protein